VAKYVIMVVNNCLKFIDQVLLKRSKNWTGKEQKKNCQWELGWDVFNLQDKKNATSWF